MIWEWKTNSVFGTKDPYKGVEKGLGNFLTVRKGTFHSCEELMMILLSLYFLEISRCLYALEEGTKRVEWLVSTMVILGFGNRKILEWDSNVR